MTQLPASPPSPELQQKIMGQMYLLMGKQVQSYHNHRRMGSNSSVPVELAQELMQSIECTVDQAGGLYAHPNAEEALIAGQKILESKVSKAKAMLDLVNGTAPNWQTECRWEAMRYLQHYLYSYDHLHLAHQGPTDLYYPTLILPPEECRGIDLCLFYLNILWIENQIMAGFPDDTLDQFWQTLHPDTLNQCEQLMINAMGKIMIGANIKSLTMDTKEQKELQIAMKCMTADELNCRAEMLCKILKLDNPNAQKYVNGIIPQISLWTGKDIAIEQLDRLFI